MIFVAPWWLLSLLPWAAFAFILLLRARPTTAVPFLAFWPIDETVAVKRMRLGRPPWSLLLLLLAMLLALIGAARPAMSPPSTTAPRPPPEIHLTAFAANRPPVSQIMVKVKTARFDRPSADVVIRTGDTRLVRTVQIGPDEEQTIVIDIPHPGPTITASIGDETRTLRRAGEGVHLLDEPHVPASVRRLVALYRTQHPGDGKAVAIGPTLSADQTGVVLAPAGDAVGPWTVVDDPLTRDVDWSPLSGGSAMSGEWEPLVFNESNVLLARRRGEVRQIRVSVATVQWPAMASFVVFWTNAMDWCAGGDGSYREDPAEGGPAGRPLNGGETRVAPRDLSQYFYLASLLFLLLAAITYTHTNVHRHAEQAAHSHG